MKIPNWYELILLALASWRSYRLASEDEVLSRPRKWLLGLSGWQEGSPTPLSYREELALFLTCPWCLGAWLAVAWWGLYELQPHWTVVAAVPWSISALLAAFETVLPE